MKVCHFFRRAPGKEAKSARCTLPATHEVPDYYFYAKAGHRSAYACSDCAQRLRMTMEVRPLKV